MSILDDQCLLSTDDNNQFSLFCLYKKKRIYKYVMRLNYKILFTSTAGIITTYDLGYWP